MTTNFPPLFLSQKKTSLWQDWHPPNVKLVSINKNWHPPTVPFPNHQAPVFQAPVILWLAPFSMMPLAPPVPPLPAPLLAVQTELLKLDLMNDPRHYLMLLRISSSFFGCLISLQATPIGPS